jgi:hypothetical protein
MTLDDLASVEQAHGRPEASQHHMGDLQMFNEEKRAGRSWNIPREEDLRGVAAAHVMLFSMGTFRGS